MQNVKNNKKIEFYRHENIYTTYDALRKNVGK